QTSRRPYACATRVENQEVEHTCTHHRTDSHSVAELPCDSLETKPAESAVYEPRRSPMQARYCGEVRSSPGTEETWVADAQSRYARIPPRFGYSTCRRWCFASRGAANSAPHRPQNNAALLRPRRY